MQEVKAFFLWVATVCGIGVAALLIGVVAYTLAPFAALVGWILTAGMVALTTGLSIRFLLLPILTGTVDLGGKVIDKWADTRMKLSQHETDRYIALSRVPADDNGNRPALIGVNPYTVLQLPAGQYKEHPNLTSLHMHNATPRQLEPPKLEEEQELKEAIAKVVRYDDIAREIPDELSLLGIHPDNGQFEIVAPDRYKTAWFVGGSNTGKTNTVYGKVADAVRWGADLVCFSGDKLLGGPQAGCLVGKRELVALARANPLARALRADKLTLAALEATLALYRTPEAALVEIPVLRMLILSGAELERRAERLRSSIERLRPSDFPPSRLVPGSSAVGGGAFPNAELPTTLVSLDPGSLGAQTLALRLRLGTPPVIARVQDDRVTLDPRTLAEDQLEAVAAAVLHALEEA
jgi:hypothetical protein